jgi:threonine/homoserine/homoserine lactone efflux protein
MPSLLEFAIIVMVVSFPRVISPSPLFVATIACGVKGGWKSGLKIAYGHTVVALLIAILLYIGVISLTTFPQFRQLISILGAISLFTFAGLQIRGTLKNLTISYIPKYGPFFIGILLTVLNPFFLIWWFTVGFKLMSDALILYSFLGVAVVFLSHMWMDYAWFVGIGFLSGRGKKIFSTRNHNIFMIALSGIFIYFGIVFLLQSFH